MSNTTEYNNVTPVVPYVGGVAYFITFVVVGSYLFFRMPFL
jgi:hypothetical protein